MAIEFIDKLICGELKSIDGNYFVHKVDDNDLDETLILVDRDILVKMLINIRDCEDPNTLIHEYMSQLNNL